ncbi:hypothetical protein IT6_10070 [Methylacidiphilum caldifontis]|uniref:hypothetical protein n=1 Tax=Methylacidiphilum caldifontis TaxID=2795386 RepID=UPI001A8E7483|nr:hypothetical protein [Methylacidiphilum caldifontis]QSR88684.1 hypothetical protein IT6_10070 [Methylacidiphilum caldifontis]
MKSRSLLKSAFLLIFLSGIALFSPSLHAQHEKHKGMESDKQSVEEKDEHEGHKMGGMEHGMMGHGMGGHGMMGGAKGSCCGEADNFDQILKEVEEAKNPKATARKLRMKADLMKAIADVYEKYAKELESSHP